MGDDVNFGSAFFFLFLAFRLGRLLQFLTISRRKTGAENKNNHVGDHGPNITVQKGQGNKRAFLLQGSSIIIAIWRYFEHLPFSRVGTGT